MPSLKNVRALRKHSTPTEQKLWRYLRGRNFANVKFRRQYPIGSYIVDFICIEKKLIIELDGGHHAAQISYDTQRTEYLNSLGYRVIRFWNNQVEKNMSGVMRAIYQALLSPHPPSSGTFSPSEWGEGSSH